MIFLVEVLDFDRKYSTWKSSYNVEKKQIFYITISMSIFVCSISVSSKFDWINDNILGSNGFAGMA